jgi:hypothetical protein
LCMLWCLVVAWWWILGHWWYWIRRLQTGHLVEEVWRLFCWWVRACQSVRITGLQFLFFLNMTASGITLYWYRCTVLLALWTAKQTDKRELINKTAVKPLLPNDQFEDAWFNTINDLEFTNTPPRDTTTFTTYGTTLWIDNDHQLWNQFYNEGSILHYNLHRRMT